MQQVEYTVWTIATGEVFSSGWCAEGLKKVEEGQAVYYGEQVDARTHIFDQAGLPKIRLGAVPMSTEEINVAINRERQRRIEAGKDFAGVWLTGRDTDQTILIGLAMRAEKLQVEGETSSVIPFKDGLNNMHMLTPDEMIALQAMGSEYVSAVYAASWALKALDPPPQDISNDAHWPAT